MEQLIKEMKSAQNKEEKVKMEAYLKNQFTFLGIKAPVRKEIEKEFFIRHKNDSTTEIINITEKMYKSNIREVLYSGRSLIGKHSKKMSFEEICRVIELADIYPWWDNVDGLISEIKPYFKKNPEYAMKFVNKYYKSNSMWLRRASIICQLGQKELTDEKALSKAILANNNDDEFFIAKAIGWALREYSKTNPKFVKDFINSHKLKPLSIKEASKYI